MPDKWDLRNDLAIETFPAPKRSKLLRLTFSSRGKRKTGLAMSCKDNFKSDRPAPGCLPSHRHESGKVSLGHIGRGREWRRRGWQTAHWWRRRQTAARWSSTAGNQTIPPPTATCTRHQKNQSREKPSFCFILHPYLSPSRFVKGLATGMFSTLSSALGINLI